MSDTSISEAERIRKEQEDDMERRRDARRIGEAQLILAEKRTALAVMRTGIAVYALPLSVLGLLIATSRYYDPRQVLHLLVPLLVLCAGLAVLGTYLVTRSVLRLRRQDKMLCSIKAESPRLAALINE